MNPDRLPAVERTVLLSGLVLISTLSWAYLWYLGRDPMAMCMVNMRPWGPAELLATFLMWTVMMVAMMVPSASPMVLAFARVNYTRCQQSLAYVPTGVFLTGYIALWTCFSAVATLTQQALHSAALLSSMMVSTSAVFGGLTLVAAGLFQLTPLKEACLRYCRSPLGFILTEWREGTWGALRMGMRHGAYCVGCCWLLMGLLFVVGIMNLWWVSGLAGLVLVERILPGGRWIARGSGVILIAFGIWMTAGQARW